MDELAFEHLRLIVEAESTDDPKWLKQRAERLRKLAQRRERALEHWLRIENVRFHLPMSVIQPLRRVTRNRTDESTLLESAVN